MLFLLKQTSCEKKMILFDTDELEVILITYNRHKFVAEWIERYVDELLARNIKISVYDSSTDEETKLQIEKENLKHEENKIRYEYITSKLSVGHVVLEAILKSMAKYVWVVGDSRCHNFSDLDSKVFPYIKSGMDHIVLKTVDNEENDGKIYADKNEMLKECLISMTCTGFYIYKTALFEPLKKDTEFFKSCFKKYDDNYGFTWMGYFLESYAKNSNHRTVFVKIPVIDIEPEKKVTRWSQKFYKCWCSDLCNVIDGISEQYEANDDLIKKVWKILGFDLSQSLYVNCKEGILNSEIYQKYKQILARVSNNVEKIESFANSNQNDLEKTYEYWRHYEEEELKNKINENKNKLLQIYHEKEICIYGAGRGGIAIQQALEKSGIVIKCFYDINAKKIGRIGNVQVKEFASDNSNSENEFIIISLLGAYTPIRSMLKEKGIETQNMYYVKFDNL